jgi:benzylsuccinate synthase
MPICEECKWFFPLEDDPTQGDCVTRVVDPRCAYWTAKPRKSEDNAEGCANFQTKS